MSCKIIQVDDPSHPFVNECAALHQSEVSAGLLSALGRPFLRKFYQIAVRDPRSFLFVADMYGTGHVSSFIVGSFDSGGFRELVLQEAWPQIAFGLIRRPWLIPRAFKVRIRYPYLPPHVEVIMTTTNRAYRGTGITKKLFEHVRQFLREHGVICYDTQVADTQPAARSFYLKVGGEVTNTFNLGGLKTVNIKFLTTERGV
jgi:GNAT superfamily N-acetyltransferase